MLAPRPRLALVLAGGAARGAYEVGVLAYVLEELARDLGPAVGFQVLSGTSVGAINACFVAGLAEDLTCASKELAAAWGDLRVEEILQVSGREVLGFVRESLGVLRGTKLLVRRGGLINPIGLRRLVSRQIRWSRIGENLRARHIDAVSISTTHVASGVTTVHVQQASGTLPAWGRDPTVIARAAHLGIDHAMASAAIPFLFPAVRIDGEYHCDGGLRQNVPLGPARRLGADRVLIVSPRHAPTSGDYVSPARASAREESLPSAFFLLGKALNALLLDRIENDVDRLQRINSILDGGTVAFGSGFLDTLNGVLLTKPVRPLRALLIRASQDIGRLAAQYVRSSEFTNSVPGAPGYVLRFLAEREAPDEADLLSYLLFDGSFARHLIELGFADAKSQHEALCKFFAGEYPGDP